MSSSVSESVPDAEPGVLRLKVIIPVFEELCIREGLDEYPDLDQPLTSSQQVFKVFSFLVRESREQFIAVHLDSKNRILAIDRVSTGSLNASIVHPRDVFKSCLLSSCAGLILVHNHPSGEPSPSREGIELTSRLKQGADLLGLRLFDHVIIGRNCYTSLADRGLLA